jgi:hypothetical protein
MSLRIWKGRSEPGVRRAVVTCVCIRAVDALRERMGSSSATGREPKRRGETGG